MKILFFTPKFVAGGAEQVAFLLASALVKNEHEITIATPSAVGEFAEKFSGNLFYMSFMDIDKGSMNIGGVTELSGYKLAEQLMSLVGTVIINWDAKGEKAGMDCADVTELIFPQRCNYFTKSVRPQKGAEALIG